MERVTAHILIPAPNVTPTPLPTRTPIPMATATATLPVSSSLSLPAQPAPTATRAPILQSFQSSAVPISQSSNLPSTVPNSSSSVPPSSFPLWGAAAAAAIGAATAYALEQRRKRKEEEARQLAEAQAEAARRNAAEEALKVRNWLLGQAMVQNALSQSGLSGREQERVRAEVRTRGVSAALGLVASLKQAAQARLVALEARITRMEERLDEAQQSGRSTTPSYPHRPPYPDPETADMTEAERLAEYKQSAAYQARQARYRQWEAQQAYLRYRQGEWANPQPAAQSKSLWQRANDWIQDKVDRFVRHPFSWMSVSYQGPFDSKNLFVDEVIYPQFSARNGLETWVYQSASISVGTATKFTSNPSGWLDFNFSNGRLTLKGKEKSDGSRVDYFIQPFALSVGQIASTPTDDPRVKIVNVSTIDIDILGKNWASLKVSQASGLSTTKTNTLPTGETIAISESFQLKGTVSIHRWPRIVVVAGAFIYIWEAAGVGAALKTLASTSLVQRAIQAIP